MATRSRPSVFEVPKAENYEASRLQSESNFPLGYLGALTKDALHSSLTWIQSERGKLLKEATRHGAVLFRSFGLQGAQDFDALIGALGIENFPYKKSLSNAVRVNFTERVFSANEAPSSVKIYLHHEMAQTPFYPTWILFFCEQAAEQGGATPICRSDILYESLYQEHEDFLQELEAKGLKYTNVMPDSDDPHSGMGRSWQSTLGVETKDEAEARLKELDYSWLWQQDSCLRCTTPLLPAVRTLRDGRKTLFNQLIAAYAGWSDDRNDPSKAIRLGDNSKLNAEAVNRMIELAYESSFDMEWQNGDAVLIDNTVVMHGRRPFEGKRRVLASLGDMQSHWQGLKN
ncbi:MAG: TauD/TfdA family dioxygenase [Planctomycetota bacterium]